MPARKPIINRSGQSPPDRASCRIAQRIRLFNGLLARYHYLGHRNTVAENLRYLVRDRHGRQVACALFGSAAWTCAARDAFLAGIARIRTSKRQRNSTSRNSDSPEDKSRRPCLPKCDSPAELILDRTLCLEKDPLSVLAHHKVADIRICRAYLDLLQLNRV